MEKTKLALDVQRSSFTRVYQSMIDTISKPEFNMTDVRGSMHLLDQKMETLNELNTVLMDILLSSDKGKDEIESELKLADEYSSNYFKLKLKVEQLTQKVSNDEVSVISANSTMSKRKLKLPTIEFKKFGGDLKDWLQFWSQFSRIHQDDNIENEDKFQYLIQATTANSRARQLVESYPPNGDNYIKVIESLKSRFGRDDLLVEVYVRELLKLVLSNLNSKCHLSTLYDKIESQLRALSTLGVTSDTCAAMLYPLVESCLSEDLIRVWQRSSLYDEDSSMKARLDNLMKFIRKEVENEERISLATAGFENLGKLYKKPVAAKNKYSIPTASDLINKSAKCIFCTESHRSDDCAEAKKWPLYQRKKKCTENASCHLCLKFGHIARKCRVKVNCANCQGHHLTIMCPKEIHEEPGEKLANENSLSNLTYSEIFLQTLAVQINGQKKSRRVRVIFDTGSQHSYITKDIAVEMEYDPIRQEKMVHMLFRGSHSEAVEHNCYRVRLNSLQDNYSCNFESLDQHVICQNISSVKQGPWLNDLRTFGIEITDTENGPIEVLIGADIFGKLLTGKKQQLSCGLVAVETLLGWTLMGKITNNNYSRQSTTMIASMLSRNVILSDLWSLDVLGINDPVNQKSQKQNEEEVMNFFLENVTRKEDGRYEVRMPWKEDHISLPKNYELAYRRLQNTIKKIKTDGYYQEYGKVFAEWLNEQIIEEVPSEDNPNICHYLPHRPVIKLSSNTTKIRPVFDASAREKNHPSLNQCLEKGVNLIELIPSILIRFRFCKIGVISDIKKAFLQIGLHESDRDFLRFLWLNENNELKVYRHARVVFGVTCSPFLLGAVIEYHLKKSMQDNNSQYPAQITKKLLTSFYVDNCVTSVDSQADLEQFIDASSRLLAEGKFELRGWEFSQDESSFLSSSLSPVLGLMWNKNLDSLQVSLDWYQDFDVKIITKRSILSAAHKLFDPIGFSCPASLYPKLLLQKTWILKLGWDAEIDEEIRKSFLAWFKELPYLGLLKVSRWYFQSSKMDSLSLHIFCDASKEAYATCIYIRSQSDLTVNVQLVQAKSRVAPVKKLTIPRLELLAATIGARLLNSILKNFPSNVLLYFWTDSTCVLSWIKGNALWKPHVWNRTQEILKLTSKEQWYYVPGSMNPADLPSRGCFPKNLVKEKWWEGPCWLWKSELEWPEQTYICDQNLVNEERRKNIISFLCAKQNFDWYYRYFSDFEKIVRLIGWIRRFLNNCKNSIKMNGFLTCSEVVSAEKMIIKLIQEEVFESIEDNKLSTLSPFLDKDGLIRIKTKVSDRHDDETFRFPYVLPSKHEVVQRLIYKEHIKNCHAGIQIVMSKLREKFWILKCRKTVRSVIHNCRYCRRFGSKKIEVPSTYLPEDRVREAAVFEIVGVDLTGPLYIRNGEKVWIVLFTCAVYRAIHLEITTSLSTDAFVQSFRRFVARRGRPSVIYSDNGKNFVGSNNAFKRIDWEKIFEFSTVQRIEWKFIPPTAAWWGGWWERLIRIVKDLLRKVLGKSSLNYKELETIVCDCEAVVNARPLTYISEDSADFISLTPAMFLQEVKETGVPDIDAVEADDLRKHFRYRLNLKKDLRRRFRSEYLGQLCLFSKKNFRNESLKVGDIVLIGDDNQKRIKWPMGCIEELIPGRDGKCRLARLKTNFGYLLRPVQKLYPFEMNEDRNLLQKTEQKDKPDYKLVKKSEDSVPRTITRYGRIVKPPQRYE